MATVLIILIFAFSWIVLSTKWWIPFLLYGIVFFAYFIGWLKDPNDK